MAVILPLALLFIVLILYLAVQIHHHDHDGLLGNLRGLVRRVSDGLALRPALVHGFHTMFGTDMRELFQVSPINLSVAIWVGFLALFGIASDDGVIMATYLDESKKERNLDSASQIRQAVIYGAQRRIRPALMTSATDYPGLVADPYLHRPWSRHNGTHGHTFVRWHVHRYSDGVRGSGALLLG